MRWLPEWFKGDDDKSRDEAVIEPLESAYPWVRIPHQSIICFIAGLAQTVEQLEQLSVKLLKHCGDAASL